MDLHTILASAAASQLRFAAKTPLEAVSKHAPATRRPCQCDGLPFPHRLKSRGCEFHPEPEDYSVTDPYQPEIDAFNATEARSLNAEFQGRY